MLWYTLPFLDLVKIESPEENWIVELNHTPSGEGASADCKQSREENYFGNLYSYFFCSPILPFPSQGWGDSVTHCSPCSGSQSDLDTVYRPSPSDWDPWIDNSRGGLETSDIHHFSLLTCSIKAQGNQSEVSFSPKLGHKWRTNNRKRNPMVYWPEHTH